MAENSGNVDDLGGENANKQEQMNPSTIRDEAVNAVNQLPKSPQAGLPGIEELLEQLERAIEADINFQPEAKAEALEQVKVLAEAGKNPQAEEKRSAAQTAIAVLRGMIDEIAGVPTLVGTWERVLPEIKEIFGLE